MSSQIPDTKILTSVCEVILSYLSKGRYDSILLGNALCAKYKQWLVKYFHIQSGTSDEDENTLKRYVNSKDFMAVLNMFIVKDRKHSWHDLGSNLGTLVNALIFGINKIRNHCTEQNVGTGVMFSCITHFFDDIVHSVKPTDEELVAVYESIFTWGNEIVPEFAPDLFKCMRHILKSVIDHHDEDCSRLIVKLPWILHEMVTRKSYVSNTYSCFIPFFTLLDVIISHKSVGNHLITVENNNPSERCSILIQHLIQIFKGSEQCLDTNVCRTALVLMKKVLTATKGNTLRGIVTCTAYDGEISREHNISLIEFAMSAGLNFAELIIKYLIEKKCYEDELGNTLLHLLCKHLYFKDVRESPRFRLDIASYGLPEEFVVSVEKQSDTTPTELLKFLLQYYDPNHRDRNSLVPLEIVIMNEALVQPQESAPMMNFFFELMRCTKPNMQILTTVYKKLLKPSYNRTMQENSEVDNVFIKRVIEIMDPECDFLFQITDGHSLVHDAIERWNFPFLRVVVAYLKDHNKHINSPVCNRSLAKHPFLIGLLKSIKHSDAKLAAGNNLDGVILLLREVINVPGIDIEAKDEKQWTAAYHAVMTLNHNVAKIVIKEGNAKVYIKNQYGDELLPTFEKQVEGTTNSQSEKIDFIDIQSLLKYKRRAEIGESPEYNDCNQPVTQQMIEHQFQKLKSMINSCDSITEDQKQCAVDFVDSAQITLKNHNTTNRCGSMTDEHKNKLRAKWLLLCEEIDPNDLCEHFISENIFTIDTVDDIKTMRTRRDRCNCFLSALYRSSDKAFQVFCNALRTHGQEYVADVLEKDIENTEETTIAMGPLAPFYHDQLYYPQQFVQCPYGLPTSAPWPCGLMPVLPSTKPTTNTTQVMDQKEPMSILTGFARDRPTHFNVLNVADYTHSSKFYTAVDRTVPKRCHNYGTLTGMMVSENRHHALPETSDSVNTMALVVGYKDVDQTSSKTCDNCCCQVDMMTSTNVASLQRNEDSGQIGVSINAETNIMVKKSQNCDIETVVGKIDNGSVKDNLDLVPETTTNSMNN